MNERLLQFIWQFQHFNKSNIETVQGEAVTIIYQGRHNHDQGPDFLEARVKIGDATWAGNVELHVKSSDWHRHNHAGDKNYSNIILHVVWEHDADISNGAAALPTLSLQDRVAKILLERFKELMARDAFVPCEPYLPVLSEMKWLAWKERMAAERLQRKATVVLSLLAATDNHWEEVFWQMLARNFGMKVNADVFEAVAKSISVNVLAKHKNQLHQLEGLLLGQAGLLEKDFKDDYPRMLKKEYLFYKKKYGLSVVPVKPFFLRMRPANFPTIRLAQLAMLVHNSSHLFSKIKETDSLKEVKNLLNVTANDYWHYHYLFDEPGEYKPKQLGTQMTESIVINTVVPVLFAYGIYCGNAAVKDKALRWLAELPPEKNTITQKWAALQVANANALESQGLIELKNNYCNQRRCLQCAVGNILLK